MNFSFQIFQNMGKPTRNSKNLKINLFPTKTGPLLHFPTWEEQIINFLLKSQHSNFKLHCIAINDMLKLNWQAGLCRNFGNLSSHLRLLSVHLWPTSRFVTFLTIVWRWALSASICGVSIHIDLPYILIQDLINLFIPWSVTRRVIVVLLCFMNYYGGDDLIFQR